jgi:uncharacterized membrane protein
VRSRGEAQLKGRVHSLDSLRGTALLLMAGFHFCFDLSLFGAARIDFLTPFWLAYRELIVVLFVGIAGAGIALAGRLRLDRLARLGGCALLVSAGTAWLFPQTWVFFGILHFLFVASLVGPLFARVPWLCLPLAPVFYFLPHFYKSFLFERPYLRFTGLSPVLQHTIDFVPLFPWLGVMLLGIFVGFSLPERISGRPGVLSRLGRHALLFYMLHQAVLLPLAWVVSVIGLRL